LRRSGQGEVTYEPESVIEASYPVLNRDDGIRIILSDGESINHANHNFLTGEHNRTGRGSDEERNYDRLKAPDKAGRLINLDDQPGLKRAPIKSEMYEAADRLLNCNSTALRESE
jgi:hypothetical protein